MVKKFSGDMTWEVTPKSKSITWKYTGGTTPYTFAFNPSSTEGYEFDYKSFATKSKKDLVITTVFATNEGKVKKVTNTIKNYFADTTVDYYKVSYVTYFANNEAPNEFEIIPNTPEGELGFYGPDFPGVAGFYLAPSGKKPPQTVIGTDLLGNLHIHNKSGNNNYAIANTYNNRIYELAGNDIYDNAAAGTLQAYDYAGNDKYFTSSGANMVLFDYAGKDEYTLQKSSFNITDYAGNDKYYVTANKKEVLDPGEYRLIYDKKGNDYYAVGAAIADIWDNTGKDKYDIYNNANVTISDAGKGNDTLNIDLADSIEYNMAKPKFLSWNEKGNETYNIRRLNYTVIPDYDNNEYAIIDEAGNDKYNFKANKEGDVHVTNVGVFDEAGNDKYNMTISTETGFIDTVIVDDMAGSDSYTLKGYLNKTVNNVEIYERKGKDKYNFDTVATVYVSDTEGNDTYKLTNTTGEIDDYGGVDKYTIKTTLNNSTIRIHDEDETKPQNDTYTVDISAATGAAVKIDDEGGAKDKLTLSKVKKADLVFMADITKDNTFDNGNLYIYDKNNQSYVVLEDFYKKGDGGAFTDFDDGRIETIKAGSTTLKDAQTTDLYNYFNGLREKVGGWLSTYASDYDSVSAVLEGTNANLKAQFVAECFTPNQP